MTEGTNNGKALNWPTVIMVIIMGGGNWLATQHGNTQLSYEQQEALSKIRELHQNLDDFEKRQTSVLTNQNTMMTNDSVLLREIHAIAERLNRLKTQDQMRGAPP